MVVLTGRVSEGPSRVLRDDVLGPQFRFEVEHLLRHYVAIEKVLAADCLRMGLLDAGEARAIVALLDEVDADALAAESADSMSDIAFALESYVVRGLGTPAPNWHADRSRNDFQACAQLMYIRESVVDVGIAMTELALVAHEVASANSTAPMPGYTQLQPAQVISPGFHLAALSGRILHHAGRLLSTYDLTDACPLGAGAMAGQYLAWDRARLAGLLGFTRPQPHALVCVASRDAAIEATAELSLFATTLSRFTTDLQTWGSGDLRFLRLPDDLSGISSAMPQKQNFPVLERIRGKTAHLTAFHVDVLLGQRNTAYASSVEVSKEAGTHLADAFGTARSVIRLLRVVLKELRFDEERMRAACEREFLGGFALANLLTRYEGVPWRDAQVLVGAYVREALERGLTPREPSPEMLRQLAEERGIRLGDPARWLGLAFDVDWDLTARPTAGSAHPDAVKELLAAEVPRLRELHEEWAARRARAQDVARRLDELFASVPVGGATDGSG